MDITFKKLAKSEVEVDAVMDAVSFMALWPKGLAKAREMVEIDGFRKGHAPEEIILARFGDMIILEEMANLALRDIYGEAIKKHNFFPISEPRVTVKKLAKDNPFEINLIVATLPEVTLPDYKALSQEERKAESTDVLDTEIDAVLLELQKGKAAPASAHDHDHDHEGHDHSHEGHDHADHGEGAEAKKEEVALPPIDDAFAQSFGDAFKTLEDLKVKIKENLGLEKVQKLDEKNRQAIMDRLIKETTAEIPDVLIDEEIGRMLSQMKADITKFGGTWPEYLAHMKKTEEDITKDWRDDAHKRVLGQLILAKIGEAEKLHASEEEIEVELIRLLAQVQDADPARAKEYLRQVLSNEKVLRFLTGKDEVVA